MCPASTGENVWREINSGGNLTDKNVHREIWPTTGAGPPPDSAEVNKKSGLLAILDLGST